MSYINLYLDETGQFQAHAFPGGYPIYMVTSSFFSWHALYGIRIGPRD